MPKRVGLAKCAITEQAAVGLAALAKVVGTLRSRHADLHFAYEAAPCDYAGYHCLPGQGLDCVVIAFLISRRAGDRIKTDRREALPLARLHRAGEMTPIYVRRPEDEVIRDLVLCHADARIARPKGRQQLRALLLRNGVRFNTDVFSGRFIELLERFYFMQ